VKWTDLKALARRPAVIFLCVALLGAGARAGYGVARFGKALIEQRNEAFVRLWNYDALEHVLIAEAINAGKGYEVLTPPPGEVKTIRAVGDVALFKAPLYQYLLAGLFRITGPSFLAFFPLQTAIGGVLSGIVSLIAFETFGVPGIAWAAGTAAALHPVLVNTASQPYNENIFFFWLVLGVWAYMRWLSTAAIRWAGVSGLAAGLGILTRELVAAPFGVMVGYGLFLAATSGRRKIAAGVLTMVALGCGLVSLWTVHNYMAYRVFVPVASISGSLLAAGNNECRAAEGIWTPFYGDLPCGKLDDRRARLRPSEAGVPRVVQMVREDRADLKAGLEFIFQNPASYLELCWRRAWTTFLPFHPRAYPGLGHRAFLLLYWGAVVVAGAIGMAREAIKGLDRRAGLLIALAGANIVPLVLAFTSHDYRFRVGADLLLGCFAARLWSEIGWYRSENQSVEVGQGEIPQSLSSQPNRS
jgi:hypothetical protein